MARCGSCHTKKSCSLRIHPQRYTFRSVLRWQVDKQRKHQNWLSLIENCIFRPVLFVCISKVHIFFNYSFICSSHSLWEHCNVNLHCIEKNLTIRNLSYQKKGFRDPKRIRNHFEVSQHTTKPKKRRFLAYVLAWDCQIFPYFITNYLLRHVTRTLISECVERYFWKKRCESLRVNILKSSIIKKLCSYFLEPFFLLKVCNFFCVVPFWMREK